MNKGLINRRDKHRTEVPSDGRVRVSRCALARVYLLAWNSMEEKARQHHGDSWDFVLGCAIPSKASWDSKDEGYFWPFESWDGSAEACKPEFN